MKVYIIGAGPGDPELITKKGARLISECPIVLYTGSLVPVEVLNTAAPDAKVLDSAGMTLDDIVDIFLEAQKNDQDVARVHTGDPAIYGSTAEQMRRLREHGIEYEIVPGVSSFAASAAALGKELTLPELSQTIIVTRMEGRTPMPEGEKLADLARHQSTMVLFLSITLVKQVVRELAPVYGEDCPVAIVYKASMPEQRIIEGTLADIEEKWKAAGIKSQSIIIVGRVLTSEDFADSRLYAADFHHKFRPAAPRTPNQ
ncbi:MAG: precorrin-4 C(11)-methyltransferase [bacterium]|nr:precorrin-4 C(11)-methyltransferase [bacterium]